MNPTSTSFAGSINDTCPARRWTLGQKGFGWILGEARDVKERGFMQYASISGKVGKAIKRVLSQI